MRQTFKKIKDEERLLNFIRDRKPLFWDVGFGDLKSLSEEAVLERVLNYGSFDDCKELLGILGLEEAARIFQKESQMSRSNYLPAIKNYFTLYFEKYVSKN